MRANSSHRPFKVKPSFKMMGRPNRPDLWDNRIINELFLSQNISFQFSSRKKERYLSVISRKQISRVVLGSNLRNNISSELSPSDTVKMPLCDASVVWVSAGNRRSFAGRKAPDPTLESCGFLSAKVISQMRCYKPRHSEKQSEHRVLPWWIPASPQNLYDFLRGRWWWSRPHAEPENTKILNKAENTTGRPGKTINHKYYNFLESHWSINPPIRALIGHLQSEIVILMINW